VKLLCIEDFFSNLFIARIIFVFGRDLQLVDFYIKIVIIEPDNMEENLCEILLWLDERPYQEIAGYRCVTWLQN
jgi:hypothetical protein